METQLMLTLPNDHISKQFDSVELEMSCTKLSISYFGKKEKLFSYILYCIYCVNYSCCPLPTKCRERLSLNCMCKTKLSTVKDYD